MTRKKKQLSPKRMHQILSVFFLNHSVIRMRSSFWIIIRIRFLPSTISRRTTRVVTWQFQLLAQEPQTLSLKFSPVWVCSTSEPASIRIKQSWKRQTARALLLIWLPSDMEPMPYITMAVTFTAVSMPFPWWDLILSPARNWWTFRVIRQTEAGLPMIFLFLKQSKP